MKPKIYPAAKLVEVQESLQGVMAQPPAFIDHEDMLGTLRPMLIELHQKKGYDAKQIAAMLRKSAVRTTIREVRGIIEVEQSQPSAKSVMHVTKKPLKNTISAVIPVKSVTKKR